MDDTHQTEKALKRLRAIKKKELTDMEHKRHDEATRTHLHHELVEAGGPEEPVDEDASKADVQEPNKEEEKTDHQRRYSDLKRSKERNRYYYDEEDERENSQDLMHYDSQAYQKSHEYYDEYSDDGQYFDPETLPENLHFIRESEILSDRIHQSLAEIEYEENTAMQPPRAYDLSQLETSALIDYEDQMQDTIIDVVSEDNVKRKKKKKSKKRHKHKEVAEEEEA